MSGYGGRKEPFKGVHDEIFARAVVFGDGTQLAAVITTDLIGLSHDFWEATTQRLSSEAGIQPDHVLLTATHSHGGPTTRVYGSQTSPDIVAYISELQDHVVGVVKKAADQMKPVQIGAGHGECKMNINRRARHPSGEITLGRNPYGVCDQEVSVIKIDDEQGKLVSLLFNWACHGTVMGPRNYDITGDWPGAASRFVEAAFQGAIVAPVTIGASGNINPIYGPHIDFHDVRSYSFSVDSIGMILGEEVVRVASQIQPTNRGAIKAAQRLVKLPPKDDANPGVPLRLSVLKVGNIVFAGVSGEVFTEIGLEIKRRSPYAHTIVMTHCNGSSGYLVTDKAYAKGGYEVRVTRAKSGAEEAIVGNLLEMIEAF
jgi:hypothetical protein